MEEAKVVLREDAGVAVITLNRPGARNALDTRLIQELQETLRKLSVMDNLRACVLTGAGTAFCAGADLKQRMGMNLEEQESLTREIRGCADLLSDLVVPVIAAVNGPAYAGGMELAIACDVRVASDRASFAFPEVKLGVFPGAGGPIRLPRLVGQGWARLMILGGDPVDAAEALRIGLVQRVVAHEKLMKACLAIAGRIAANGAEAVRSAKELMNRTQTMPYREAVELSDSLRTPLNRMARWSEGLGKQGGQS